MNPNASILNGGGSRRVGRASSRSSPTGRNRPFSTLAAAYAEAGRFSQAAETAQQALALATSQNNMALAKIFRARIKLYQGKLPTL